MSAQIFGLTIAYVVNAARPWGKSRPVRAADRRRGHRHVAGHRDPGRRQGIRRSATRNTSLRGGAPAVGVVRLDRHCRRSSSAYASSLVFLFKFREAHAAAALHQAEAERHLMSKHAVEAELKLMQAQVEPHFLFNTLASVQYLTETDPARGRQAAVAPDRLPARRAAAAARELDDAGQGGRPRGGVSQHPADAHGRAPRLHDRRAAGTRRASVSAEPADLAGRERDQARRGTGGRRRRRSASPRGATATTLTVSVIDTGRGGAAPVAGRPGNGVGLANVRERLAALYGARGRFTLVR